MAAQQTDSPLPASVAAGFLPWSVVSLKSPQTCESLSDEELQSALTDVKTTQRKLPLPQPGISQKPGAELHPAVTKPANSSNLGEYFWLLPSLFLNFIHISKCPVQIIRMLFEESRRGQKIRRLPRWCPDYYLLERPWVIFSVAGFLWFGMERKLTLFPHFVKSMYSSAGSHFVGHFHLGLAERRRFALCCPTKSVLRFNPNPMCLSDS